MNNKKENTYKAIEKLSNEEVKKLYLELKDGKLKKGSKVQLLQNELTKENGIPIPILTVKYKLAMETIERFLII